MTWLYKTWLRILALLLGATLTVIALVSLAAAPVWPVLGVTMAAVALVWKGAIAPRITHASCLQCGESVKGLPHGQYGVICGNCGAINEQLADESTTV
ncbi:MAG: hypothetical protein JSR77_15795 [Planctomycetes bacterium]|nr:hypothetical protein [Planctomycetota bacterium]